MIVSSSEADMLRQRALSNVELISPLHENFDGSEDAAAGFVPIRKRNIQRKQEKATFKDGFPPCETLFSPPFSQKSIDFSTSGDIVSDMRKLFQKRLLAFAAPVCLLALLLIFILESAESFRTVRNHLELAAETLQEELDGAQSERARINEILEASLISKAKIVSLLLMRDKNNLKKKNLLELLPLIGADEICISDSSGILVAGSRDKLIGFDMASTEQSRPFLAAIGDQEFELVQDMTPRGLEGHAGKYAGVARLDEPGIVQVGVRTSNDETAETAAFLQNLLKNRNIGSGGRILLVRGGAILCSPRTDEIGHSLASLGFERLGFLDLVRLSGKTYLCCESAWNGYEILMLADLHEILTWRNHSMILLAAGNLVLFLFLFIVVTLTLKRLVVRVIYRINRSLERIIAGDLDVVLSEKSTPEFAALSDGINATVAALKTAFLETDARSSQENSLAKSIQASILPRSDSLFRGIPELDCDAKLLPGKETGADCYSFFLSTDGSPMFLVTDISVHGMRAALFLMKFRALLQDQIQTADTPSSLFQNINRILSRERLDGLYVSAFCAKFDATRFRLIFCNAGYVPPLFRAAGDASFRPLKQKTCPPLSGSRDALFESHELEMRPGDAFFLCSDAVLWAKNKNDFFFTRERAIATLNAAPAGSSAKRFLSSMENALLEFIGDVPLDDDVVFFSLTRKNVFSKRKSAEEAES